MGKNCFNCYWRYENEISHCTFNDVQPIGEICNNFDYKCSCGDEQAVYKYKDNVYCEDCMKNELGVQTYTIEHYEDANGEYLGSETDDFLDILQSIDKEVKEL